MSASSASQQDFGGSIKLGDKNMWNKLNEKARGFLLQMSVFIISVKESAEDVELWNSYFIQTLRYWGLKIKVLSNPCIPKRKTVPDTGAAYVGDATLRGLCASESAWVKLSASPQSLGVLGSHLNAWYEAHQTCWAPYAWVMEEDVHASENSVGYILELAELVTRNTKDAQKIEDLQMIHLVHGEGQHNFLKAVVNSATVSRSKNIFLQAVPRDARGKPEMVGTGFRSYWMHRDAIAHFIQVSYKWYTWCDMQVLGV